MPRKAMFIDIKILLVLVYMSTLSVSVGATDDDESFITVLRETVEKGGIKAVNAFLSQQLDEWKTQRINIAVTGNSGAGKSSFVNALRGLTADDDGAAEVGVVETTKKPESYKHPNNDQLLLWDLPGIGTPTFTYIEYLDKIKAWMYDYFIIISSSRFTENDIWLAKELTSINKTFYFVRSKISTDVENDRKSHPKTHDKKKLLSSIRYDCEKNLDKTGYNDDVYLIDTFERDAYDFPKLSYKLVIDAPTLKREAVLFTLKSFSEDFILESKEALEERIHYVALISGIVGAIPIPGLDIAFDLTALVREANFYKQQFGLSDEALKQYAEQMGMSIEALTESLDLTTQMMQFTAKGIAVYMTKLGAKKMTTFASGSVLKYVLPGIGSLIGGGASYMSCYNTLESLLEMTAQDALKISIFLHNKITNKRDVL